MKTNCLKNKEHLASFSWKGICVIDNYKELLGKLCTIRNRYQSKNTLVHIFNVGATTMCQLPGILVIVIEVGI